jgi:mono/diheme cytochrome c family protein
MAGPSVVIAKFPMIVSSSRSAAIAAILAALTGTPAQAQQQEAGADTSFTAEQIEAGSKLFANNCSRCHGAHMGAPLSGVFDLRTFPSSQRNRFFNSVSNGKNSMPPWKSLFSKDDIGNLFAYVVAGEKK